jgi:peptidoglycan/LPS O-acetylase OafA/YrhL
MPNLLKGVALGGARERYPALTGVRAVGASAVFFDHFTLWPGEHVVINVMAFFFLLSGFLIARIYYAQVRLSPAWLRVYFVNRFARIYPVYFVLLSVAVLLNHDVRPRTLFSNYTLTHALFHGTPRLIQPSWSLTVEECFYFMAPGFLLLARRYSFLAPFSVGCLLLAGALAVSRLGFAFLGGSEFVMNTTFFGHFAEFFAGFWLALRVIKLEQRGAIRVPGGKRTAVGLVGVGILIGAMMLVYRQPRLDVAAIIAINNFLIPIPIAVLYEGLMTEDTRLARALSGRFIGLLGRASYSFYLMHSLVIDHLSLAFLPVDTHRALSVLFTFGLTWLLSVLLFAWFEEPLNLFIRRALSGRAPEDERLAIPKPCP